MINFIKKQPLVGLALAIAGGYVLAHIVIKILDDDFEQDPGTAVAYLFIGAVLLTLVYLIYKKRVLLKSFIRRHPQKDVSAPPPVIRSKLEVLFATDETSHEIDKILQSPKSPSRESLAISVMILAYAGQRAARLRDAIKITKAELPTKVPTGPSPYIKHEFDQIFTEAVALCFWSVMNKYWNGDEGDFWVEDESADLDYLEALRDALDFADYVIGDSTSAVPKNYLHSDVHSYCGQSIGSASAMDRFTNNILTWTLRGPMTSDSIRRIVTAFCLKMIGEVNRHELDGLCSLAYARNT